MIRERVSPLTLRVIRPYLVTERLVLRPYEPEDAPRWIDLQSRPDVTAHLPWPRRSPRQSQKHLLNRVRHDRLTHHRDFMALAVCLPTGAYLGDASMHMFQNPAGYPPTASLGWITLPEYQGQGYATEAATALARLAFGTLGACLVSALIQPHNAPSIAVARRLGMEYRGHHPQDGNLYSTGKTPQWQ